MLLNRRLWLGLFFSVGCLVLAMIDIDFGEMAAALRSANPAWLAAAAATVLLGRLGQELALAPAAYTQHPSPPAAAQAAVSQAHRPAASDQHLDWPGRRGQPGPRRCRVRGDLLRVYLAGEAGGLSKSLVLGTIAAEKLLDMVLLAVCFLGLVLFVAMPQELAQRQTSTVGRGGAADAGGGRAALAARAVAGAGRQAPATFTTRHQAADSLDQRRCTAWRRYAGPADCWRCQR